MNLYGLSELATVLGQKPGTVRQWYARGKLPEPDERLAAGPVWSERRIRAWLESRDPR